MTNWDKKQRLEAVFAGEPADRPPVSAWRHFIDREQEAGALAEAMIEFQTEFDWDFVKINPRATYYAEIWGNTYDFGNYEGMVPKVKTFTIHDSADLEHIKERGMDCSPLQEQLEAIRLTREGLGKDIPIMQTLFSPLTVLEYLCGNRTLASNRPAIRSASPLPALMANYPEQVHRALQQISLTLGNYVQEAQKVGADGFFYSVMGLARDGYLTVEEYDKFARPYDLQVLEASNPASVILHTCGPDAHPERFVHYPISAIHWADRSEGSTSLADSSQWIGNKVAMGGVDETLFVSDNKEEVTSQGLHAIDAMRNRPFILAPGCGLPLNANQSAVKALRSVVEEIE
ncbi:uroporphyrinogen decarboxylase family protein [Sporosarcina limicola]|uniref:Uroporphyrinogen decarboxylase n=1 Tax=Sporosarcina limicola TaxID=34101 RepID=A0A927MGC3_9BACL|nr:uroporphyrinogen decarboxylase family protein [Sporosarcina limicola]MBE1553930.1 uroporphyrinogen decarboxylase [Sporosarcina limicola]